MPMYYFFLLLLFFPSCFSIDTITFNNSITEKNILLSKKGIFALGFFSPGKSKYRYLGIWYHKLPVKTVVWVANRNTPINGSSGIFSINSDGNLVIYADHNQEFPVWSTNVSVRGATEGSVAQILDSGNLVLIRNGETVWQSFDYPTDTTLPVLARPAVRKADKAEANLYWSGCAVTRADCNWSASVTSRLIKKKMLQSFVRFSRGLKVGLDRRLGLNKVLTSWTSSDDPGTGDWMYKLDPSGSPQYFLSKGSTRYWRSDPWPWEVKQTPSYIPVSAYNQDEIYYTFLVGDESVLTRIVITVSGLMQRLTWDNTSSQWRESRSEPKYVYGHCGAYSILNANNFEGLECQCLPGYEPKSLPNWYLRDGSAGCVKKRNETRDCRNGEGFVKVGNVKLPDTSVTALLNRNLSSKVCEKMCLKNCSCKAFAKLNIESKGIGCLTWYGELMDTVQNTEGHDIYVRVDAEELAEYATKRKGFLKKKGLAILVISVVLAMFFIGLSGYVWMTKKRKRKVKNRSLFSSSMRYETEENRQSDLLVLSLRAISIATNNFDPANKLGQGGFGSVYKGQLDDGEEIAVKRLSRNSGQGAEEFENEIVLIAKLQHRNLVKLLGCCIQKEEQMLIYEYLPNKSLDHFIFDQRRKPVLDWRKRFNIILGIARGMLYLHHDSRLRIIHRDLKTSNVLLDADMNPKISDFGMARIFKGDQVQDKTNRVVGTYGYMAPEYAVFGKFSTKSDVFSFGVILLEIISSKKCSSAYPEGPSLNLIGHVWELWKEDKTLEMVDPSVREQSSIDSDEVSRCIQIGLLCVQEKAEDRPNMSNVVLMLNGQASLPCPKHPAFLFTTDLNPSFPTHPRDTDDSVNELTISKLHAR